jgi:hypothetical protein
MQVSVIFVTESGVRHVVESGMERRTVGADPRSEETTMTKIRMIVRSGWIATAVLVLGLSTTAPADEPTSTTRQVQDMQVQALQQDMLSNPDLLRLVLALQKDRVVQDILSDPELMERINSGDLSALEGDPRIERLANHPTVKGMARDLER